MAFGFYRSITIDKTLVGGVTHTDKDVLVKLSHTTLRSVSNGGNVQNVNGYDLCFAANTDGSTLYSWEVQKYDAVNGIIIARVKVPSVSHSVNTVLYAVYGDSGISTFQGGSAGAAYDSANKLVIHGGDGSTLDLADKTTNGNNGTNSSATATAGKINGAVAMSGGSKFTMTKNLASIIGSSAAHTISFWAYFTTQGATNYLVDLDVANGLGMFCNIKSGDAVEWGYGGSYRTYTSMTSTTGTWYRFTLIKSASGDNGRFLKNGVLQSTYSSSLGNPNAAASTGSQFGAYHSSTSLCIDGKMEEFHISNTDRGDAWELCSFNNENDPGNIGAAGFYTVGSETAGVVTTTKTETGVARIQKSVTKTETGVARITASTTKTETGVARVTKSTTQTETGVARLTASTARTITGVARIQVATTRNITGLARITGTTTRTETGISRITNTTTQNVTGVARVGVSVNRTETGVARITRGVTQNITGVARIQKTPSATISGVARITASATKNETGVAKIVIQTTRTITGVANISVTSTTKTETGVARIQKTRTRTITGKAFIIAAGSVVTAAEIITMPFDNSSANQYSPSGGFNMP